jgi:amino acid permease
MKINSRAVLSPDLAINLFIWLLNNISAHINLWHNSSNFCPVCFQTRWTSNAAESDNRPYSSVWTPLWTLISPRLLLVFMWGNFWMNLAHIGLPLRKKICENTKEGLWNHILQLYLHLENLGCENKKQQQTVERTNSPTLLSLSDKLNRLRRCGMAQNYIILHKVVQRLFQRNFKISHRRHI